MLEKILTFPYTGVIFNALIVAVGAFIGLAARKGIPEKITSALLCGMGLCTLYIGISGAISAGADKDANPILPILAIAPGVFIGTLVDIDGALNKMGNAVEKKFTQGNGEGKIAEGFISACLLFCVGSMTIVGAINAGVLGDNTIYFTKGMLDFVAGMALAVSLGVGVALSSLFVLVFQGGLVLLAGLIEPILTSHMISEMNCVGSLLIVVIGLNLMGITKIKVANFLPAILLAMLLAIVI